MAEGTTPASMRMGVITSAALWFGAFGLGLILDGPIGLTLGGPISAYIFAFVLLTIVIMASAMSLSQRWPDRSGVWAIGVGLVLVVFVTASDSSSTVYGLLVGFGLLIICLTAGAMIGRRIEEPNYLWPLTLVMVCFDLWSVFSSQGITQELVLAPEAQETRALLVLAFPVPGLGVEPVLGIGDVIVVSLLYSAVSWLGLSLRRLTIGLGLGFVLCLTALVITSVPLPALAFIAPCGVAALGQEAKPRISELVMAAVFCLIGLTVLTLIRS